MVSKFLFFPFNIPIYEKPKFLGKNFIKLHEMCKKVDFIFDEIQDVS